MVKNKELIIFDIETDALEALKINVLSYSIKKIDSKGFSKPISIYTYEDMRKFFKSHKNAVLIGHNIASFDLDVLEKLLNIKINNQFIDTLHLNWFLFSYRKDISHGLEALGKTLGIEKIEVDESQWSGNDIELFTKRCETDVLINTKLFIKQMNMLWQLQKENAEKFLEYLYFKSLHIKINNKSPFDLDVYNSYKIYYKLKYLLKIKQKRLTAVMPYNIGKVLKRKPKNIYKKDGSLSKAGLQWFNLLKEHNYHKDADVIYEKPNPGSIPQIKKWLFDFGWEPDVFKKNKKGKKIPQISKEPGKLSDSVLKLAEEHEEINELKNYFTLVHRVGIFEGYLTKRKDNKIAMEVGGFTKTMRLSHKKPLVNLPKEEYIRKVLQAPDGYTMIGFDLKGLEDRTKQHFIYPYDPEYVKTMQEPDFDPHLDIAIRANIMTEKEANLYKQLDEENSHSEIFNKLKGQRAIAKRTNFACTYKAQPKRLSEDLKISMEEATNIHKVYWERNWAISKFEESLEIKKFGSVFFIKNPLNGFFIPLTSKKDAFSAVNQNAGSYVFDTLIKNLIIYAREEPYICYQYHDEAVLIVKDSEIEYWIDLLKRIEKITNNELNMNVYIPIDIKTGKNYWEVH